MLIKMSRPDMEHIEKIETGVCDVEITEAYIGPMFISDGGEELFVMMRDNGFELSYLANGFSRRITLNEGSYIIYEKKEE